MKTVYVLCGLPFSGKSTIVKQLNDGNALVIERDVFLESINRGPQAQARIKAEAVTIQEPESKMGKTREENAFNDALTLEYCRRVRDEIERSTSSTVIVDGTHLQPLSRSFIRGLTDAKMIAIVVDTSAEECIKRLSEATLQGIRKTVTPELIRRLSELFVLPTVEEGFAEVRLGHRNQ